MHVVSLEGNPQRLDGGAMFGHAPRALWSRWCPPDDQNRIRLACRSFLVEAEGRLILLEAGIGLCFPPALRQRYGVEGERHLLLDALSARGLSHEDIDAVVLSHLHFDHAGGLLAPREEGEPPRLLFPRARFVVGREAWERARRPHVRDGASFLPELPPLLEASGRLELIDGERAEATFEALRFRFSSGHTVGLTHAVLLGKERRAIFASDLVPGRPWVHLPITMGYDRCAERLIDEKAALYADLDPGRDLLLYTHDPACAASAIGRTPEGRWQPVAERTSLDEDL